MAKIHVGATLTPHSRDFLPGWVARQPWYLGSDVPSLSPVGYFRLEDPAGDVGIETHLVTDGSALYQIPMTYRGHPFTNEAPGAANPLITTAEHSVLGTRWIYDAVADPVWVAEVLRLIRTNGKSDPSSKRGVGFAEAQGHQLTPKELTEDTVTIELQRVVTTGQPADEAGIAGLITGNWCPDGPGTPPVTGCLAVVRETSA